MSGVGRREPQFSIGKLAVFSLGAGTLVLAATVLVLFALTPGPVLGLTVALSGMAAAVAAMGVVSKRMTNRALDRIEEADRQRAADGRGSDIGP